MKQVIGLMALSLSLLLLFSCQQKSEYHKMVDRELATGMRYDTLFYGIYLGMPSKEFYTHCWNLNKQGWIKQGAGNTSVYAKIPEFKYPASMSFYPTFHEGKIIGMPAEFIYESWAPWSKHLYSDSLIVEVKDLMEQWYGDGFLEIENPNKILGGSAFVKVNGNRRISIYKVDDVKVRVDFIDLLEKKRTDKLAKAE